MDRRWLYYLGLVLVAAIWGSNFGVSRSAMETFDPILFSFIRFGLAVPFIFIILYFKEGSIRVPWKVAIQLAMIGILGVTVLEIAVMYSIKYTTLANASLLNVAPWPIVALFTPLFFKEKLSSRLLVGGVAAIAGVCLIILGGAEGFNLSPENRLGNFLAFGVSIIGALSNVATMPYMRHYSSLRISAWITFFGALFLGPLTFGSWGEVEWNALTSVHYSAVFYNVIFCTVIAFVVWNACMFKVGAARANFFRYVVPAAAVIAGYLFYDESFSGWQLFGALFMVAGLLWISIDKSQPVILQTET